MEIVLQSRVVVLGFPLHQSRHSCCPSRVCFGWKGLWGLPLHRWPQPAAFLGEGLAGERAGRRLEGFLWSGSLCGTTEEVTKTQAAGPASLHHLL